MDLVNLVYTNNKVQKVNVHEAKTHLSRLLEQVLSGEEVIISKAGKPVAKLIPLEPEKLAKRKPGLLKGKMRLSANFDDPLPLKLLLDFQGGKD